MTTDMTLRVPPEILRKGGFKDDEDAVRYGTWGIQRMCEELGVDDLGESEVLDIGCGFSLTQAIVNRGLPIRRYAGVDVSEEIIGFLRENVQDPRFEFHRIDAQNEMYNPAGEQLTDATKLPIGDARFDLICLFSVFTHMVPDDYVSMLRILRNHVKPDGRLFFSIYIDELTEGGHGLMDRIAERAGKSHVGQIETFQDLNPAKPLDWAVYSERYARELMEGAGWSPLSLSPPATDPASGRIYIQHHFVCAPA
jgi:SAM-dependent methyltransferase